MPASLVIVNPRASRLVDERARTELIDTLRRTLTARDGVPPTIVVPDSVTATREAVRDAVAAGIASVVGVGGDGTLKDIASVTAGSGILTGIVPGGTGNVLAGVLGIPGSIAGAVRALATAEPRTIDLGEVDLEAADAPAGAGPERTAFMVGVGIGFDARVMATTPPELKRRLGRAAYFARAAWLAARIDVVPYHVTVDGERFDTEGSIAMAINLGELVPGSVATRLPVVPDDGLLDVFVLGARGPIAGVRGLFDHLVRTDLGHGAGGSTIRLRGRQVRLESVPPEPMQVDGDHLGPGALVARVVPGALRILTPA